MRAGGRELNRNNTRMNVERLEWPAYKNSQKARGIYWNEPQARMICGTLRYSGTSKTNRRIKINSSRTRNRKVAYNHVYYTRFQDNEACAEVSRNLVASNYHKNCPIFTQIGRQYPFKPGIVLFFRMKDDGAPPSHEHAICILLE